MNQRKGGMLYPIGRQNLEDIRRGGYVYIDKTALIYKLASTGKYYVLGRPRRFGQESADFNDGGIFPREKGTL